MKRKSLPAQLALAVFTSFLFSSGSLLALSHQQSTQQPPPKLTPEQIEALKQQREKAIKVNALIVQAQEAMNAKNWQDAIAPLQQAIAIDPTRWQLYQGLGNAQYNLGKYDDAVQSFEKAIQAAESNTTVDPVDPSTDPARKKAGEAQILTSEGNAFIKLKKNTEAIAAYTKAAALDPNPTIAYFNLCATQYNLGNVDAAIPACDKAIQLDPKKADAYFIKGSAMYGNGTLDKNNKYIVPPGTVEALTRYLDLAPEGGHAADVKAMLEAIGVKFVPKKQ